MKVLRPFLLSVFLFLPSLLLAQTGSIAGVVTDSTGALVGSAQVTATHVGTGAVRTLQSSESGAYSIPNLPVGKYVVSFEKSGFKPWQRSIALTAGGIVTLNCALEKK